MTHADTCCFTGHRPARLPWGSNENSPRCRDLKERLAAALENTYRQGYRHFLCGMAQGADLYFGEAVVALRAVHPEVKLEAAIPFEGQADRWPEADRRRRQALLDACDYESVVQHRYGPGCMQRRNRFMVNRSSLLLAVYDEEPGGGTAATVLYAVQKGVPIVLLDP